MSFFIIAYVFLKTFDENVISNIWSCIEPYRHPHCKVHSSVIVRYAVQLKCARLPNALAVRYGWSVSNGRWVIVHKHRGPVSGRASSAESYCWLGSPAVRTAVKSRSWRSVAPESRVVRPVTGPDRVRTGLDRVRLRTINEDRSKGFTTAHSPELRSYVCWVIVGAE